MLKKTLFTALLLSGLAASPAQAAFLNAYAVGNWTQDTGTGNGFINTTGAPNSVSLTGDNSGGADPVIFSITVSQNVFFNFDWFYNTSDATSDPTFDPFGYSVDGNFFQLSNDLGAVSQNGSITVPLLAGHVFAFEARSFDGSGGAATGVISNFTAATPIPGAVWLFGSGIAGLIGAAKRKKAKAIAI